MKKTSTKKHLKRTVILASLIFGSLLLIACGGYEKTGLSGETPWVMSEYDRGIIEKNINTLLDNYKDGEGYNIFEPLNVKLKEGGELDKVEEISEVFGNEKHKKFATHPDSVPTDAYYTDSDNNKFIDLYKYKTNTSNNSTPSKEDLNGSDKSAFEELDSKVEQAVLFISGIKQDDILNGVSNDTINHLSTEYVATIRKWIIGEITPYTPNLILGEPKDADFSKLYIKMSNLDYFVSLMNGKNNDDTEPVIENVNVIKKNGRTALDFTELANANIKIDFDTGNNVLSFSNKYRGGIIAKKGSLSVINPEKGNFKGALHTTDFEYKKNNEVSVFNSFADIDSSKLPSFTQMAIEGGNIYETGIDKILEKYYGKGMTINFPTGEAFEYDAKEALGGTYSKRMFDDSGNLNSDISSNQSLKDKISINPEFASYLIKNGVNLKNVIIKEGTWTYITESNGLGTIVNSVVDADMSGENKAYVKGLVRFNGKSPKDFRTETTAKIILTQFDESMSYHRGIHLMYDISNLGDNQNTIINDKNTANIFYLSSDKESLFDKLYTGIDFAQAYIIYDKNTNTAKYKANSGNIKEYSNKALEDWGNSDVSPSPINLKEGTGTINYNNSMSTLSRANNIKLTPVQKLLLDDQHIYG